MLTEREKKLVQSALDCACSIADNAPISWPNSHVAYLIGQLDIDYIIEKMEFDDEQRWKHETTR